MTTFNASREIQATCEQVFAAFSQPERLARWWGPAGFRNTFEVCEFKTGGRWSFVMHGPDGRNYPNESVFAEIESPRKVVVQHVSEPKFRLTVTLAPSALGTMVSWSQAFESSEVARQVEAIVVPANEQNLDRLSAEVKSHKPHFFNKDAAQAYDERNRKLAPISDSMHFLIRLVLKDLPARSRVLCVGVGTGAEILSLSKASPEWTFLGVDPSAEMLEVCRENLRGAGVLDRCQLVQGYVQDLPTGESFDGAVSVLVGHFVKREERLSFYRNITDRVRRGGLLVDTEISFDLNSQEFPLMLKNWEQVQSLMGATPESLASLPMQLREMLAVLSPAEIESLMRQCGISTPIRFFQAFMISGWYGRKD